MSIPELDNTIRPLRLKLFQPLYTSNHIIIYHLSICCGNGDKWSVSFSFLIVWFEKKINLLLKICKQSLHNISIRTNNGSLFLMHGCMYQNGVLCHLYISIKKNNYNNKKSNRGERVHGFHSYSHIGYIPLCFLWCIHPWLSNFYAWALLVKLIL